MTVLVFDPSYSNYMQDLGVAIAFRTNASCEAVLSSRAYSLYASRIKRNVYRQPDVRVQTACDIGMTANGLVWGRGAIDEARPFYERWLRDLFSIKTPTFCLFHNERFLWCALGIVLCKEQGIPFVVLERGAFRPLTSSADSRGTNANSYFRTMPHDMVASKSVDAFRLDSAREVSKSILPKFAFFLFWASLEVMLSPSRRLLFHKRYSVANYLDIGCGFLRRKLFPRQAVTPPIDEEKILLVALQRPGDTQLTFSKTYPGMQGMVDLVASAVTSLTDDWKVFLKLHPYDTGTYDNKGMEILRSGDVADLINKCSVVLTFNSTVGFEALLHEKPCVCLGESFFTKPEYVYKPCDLSAESIRDAINAAVSGGPKHTEGQIVNSVLNGYQIPGDFFRYDNLDIKNAADILCDRYLSV
ncbi:hypothetical protein [Halomonas smyrnensis]|uniref:capsular polysaccharide export protein, LipB/KpsS family n=1 Tax=Halomonas smyrnensis TaxID=720605 RepID=UPI0009FF1AE0|nr:hypothetical protein [Halomonas smyrnensis]